MFKRKRIGWAIFLVLVLVLSAQLPRAISHAFYLAGLKLYASHRYHPAAAAFEGAVLFRPTFARGYIELGSAYLAAGSYRSAEESFVKASSIKDDSCASCGLGMTYYYLERYDEAKKTFERAVKLNPNDACAYSQSGRMYYDQRKYQEAITAFKRAVSLQPDSSTYFLLGNAYVWLREYSSGVDAYKQALRLNPKDPGAHRQLGVAYSYLERYEQAVEEYKRAIELNPEDPKPHWGLALAYESMNNKQGVVEQYQILQMINPDTAYALLERSALLQGREKGKERLYFIPVGKLPSHTLNNLLAYYKRKSELKASCTPPLSLESVAINTRRRQLIAEEAIELIKRSYPNLAKDPNAILIGLTQEDMYIRGKTWRFAYSYRTGGRFAVISGAHLGDPVNDDLLHSRMRKMVMKDIGILFYQLSENDNPKSVLYYDISGVEDFDRMDANEIDRWNE